MILVALMFVFGAWNVQQMAQLPSLTWLFWALPLVIAIFSTQIHPRFSSNFQPQKFITSDLLCAAAFLFGVAWTSSFAYWRMSDELSQAWEPKTISIEIPCY